MLERNCSRQWLLSWSLLQQFGIFWSIADSCASSHILYQSCVHHILTRCSIIWQRHRLNHIHLIQLLNFIQRCFLFQPLQLLRANTGWTSTPPWPAMYSSSESKATASSSKPSGNMLSSLWHISISSTWLTLSSVRLAFVSGIGTGSSSIFWTFTRSPGRELLAACFVEAEGISISWSLWSSTTGVSDTQSRTASASSSTFRGPGAPRGTTVCFRLIWRCPNTRLGVVCRDGQTEIEMELCARRTG